MYNVDSVKNGTGASSRNNTGRRAPSRDWFRWTRLASVSSHRIEKNNPLANHRAGQEPVKLSRGILKAFERIEILSLHLGYSMPSQVWPLPRNQRCPETHTHKWQTRFHAKVPGISSACSVDPRTETCQCRPAKGLSCLPLLKGSADAMVMPQLWFASTRTGKTKKKKTYRNSRIPLALRAIWEFGFCSPRTFSYSGRPSFNGSRRKAMALPGRWGAEPRH